VRNSYKLLVGKPAGKRPLGDLDLRKIGMEGVDWIHLDQDRDRWQAVVNMVMNLWVP
jgi:hypothetical protein